MREPIQTNLPSSTVWYVPEIGQPSDTIRYRSRLNEISYKIENGRVLLCHARVAISKQELRTTRSWRHGSREVWVETRRFSDTLIFPTRGSNRLFSSDKLDEIASKLIDDNFYFDSDFIEWLLGPTEDRLNEVLREANEQIAGSKKVVSIAA